MLMHETPLIGPVFLSQNLTVFLTLVLSSILFYFFYWRKKLTSGPGENPSQS